MEELEIYKKVNRAKTLDELADVITETHPNGFIMGRSRTFDANRMADHCRNLIKHHLPFNVLTREYGIRQQAIMITYYERADLFAKIL